MLANYLKSSYFQEMFCIIAIILFSFTFAQDDSVVPNYTIEDFGTNLEKGPHFILFYAPWCGHCKKAFPAWEALGKRFNSDEAREATIAKVDCSVETALCSEHNIMGYPTMKFFHDGQSKAEAEVYKGARDVTSFEDFVIAELKEQEEQATPTAGAPSAQGGLYELTTKTFEGHTQLGDHFIKFYAPWCHHCKELAPTWVELAKTFEKTRSLTIAKVDCMKERDLCSKYGIRAYPTMLWFRNGEQLDAYKQERSLQGLKNFVNDKIAQVDQSAQSDAEKILDYPIPGEEEGAVVPLDDSNFDILLNQRSIVLVKFFVTWCGHCQSLAPVYKELGELYNGDQNVAIAEVNCEDNKDICDKFQVQGYPTILLFRNGRKFDEYSGPRDLDHLSSYISEQMAHDEL